MRRSDGAKRFVVNVAAISIVYIREATKLDFENELGHPSFVVTVLVIWSRHLLLTMLSRILLRTVLFFNFISSP